jgi:Ca2+-binding EF-hand superfamily protein
MNELGKICEEIDVSNKCFKNLDLDGNGKIDFAEFQTATINKRRIVTKENLL